MAKALFCGLWVLLVTLGASFAVTLMPTGGGGDAAVPATELIKMKPLTVPVVSNSGIEGHLFAQLSYRLDKTKYAEMKEEAEPLLAAQSFRALYGTQASRYMKPKKADLEEITSSLVEYANQRLGADMVREVLIEELSFIPKESSRLGGGR